MKLPRLGKPRSADCWNLVQGDDRGWILHTFADEIEKHSGSRCTRFRSGDEIGPADVTFFVHVSRLIQYLDANRKIDAGVKVVLFTHWEPGGRRSEDEIVKALLQADRIAFMSLSWQRWAAARGIPSEKTRTLPCGADPNRFSGSPRTGKTMGFVARYNPGGRKNHPVLFELIRRLAPIPVLVAGPGWEQAPGYPNISSLPHVRFLGFVPSDRFPEVYAAMTVFVNVSKVEGGPMPLLEAMMCNRWPVSTRVGFAEEIIREGENGTLLDSPEDVDGIERKIREALGKKTDSTDDVRSTVLDRTWERFVRDLKAFITDPGAGQNR